MKYVWLLLVICGGIGIYMGWQQLQVEKTQTFGEYPCFQCASVNPDFEILVFSKVACSYCETAGQRVRRFCQVTGVRYGNTFYDDADESFQKLNELGLEWNSEFLVVILQNGRIIGTHTSAATAEQFLSETLKEAAQL
ncbi:MAG: hypothetical protein HXS46_14255 [Theionarchaea archaeon]|nr:MAG: hypothetical protein AYK18_04110 [Theionarchaea archaeon DG-70]MBU7011847.1 hypothetical protein [Theionarchaea archaeon]